MKRKIDSSSDEEEKGHCSSNSTSIRANSASNSAASRNSSFRTATIAETLFPQDNSTGITVYWAESDVERLVLWAKDKSSRIPKRSDPRTEVRAFTNIVVNGCTWVNDALDANDMLMENERVTQQLIVSGSIPEDTALPIGGCKKKGTHQRYATIRIPYIAALAEQALLKIKEKMDRHEQNYDIDRKRAKNSANDHGSLLNENSDDDDDYDDDSYEDDDG